MRLIIIVLVLGCAGELVGPDRSSRDAGEVDAPVTDVPITDAPVTDVPIADAPVTDVPVTDSRVPDAGPDVAIPTATCGTIADFLPGSSTCRDGAERCSVTIPTTSSCTDACGELGLQCLRAYEEASTCIAAVEKGALACDTPPEEFGFCQCGDPSATYDEWVVVTIGDSTMSNRNTPGESGWGDALSTFGVRPDDVVNEGSSGASSRDFETRSNWPRAEALLGPNVFLLIQFGHNDLSSSPDRHTEAGLPPDYDDTYRERLEFYVAAARSAGATPIIMTSMGQMFFDGALARDTNVTQFANAATAYATSDGLLLLDAHRASRAEFTRLGPEETISQYSFDDTTHFTPAGALRLAELMVRLGCIESEAFCAQFVLP